MEPERGTRKGQMEGGKEGSTMQCLMVKAVQKFHDKIKQLKENLKRKEFNDDFVKAFLESNPTETVLIPTEEIRFGRFFNQPRFQGRSRSL